MNPISNFHIIPIDRKKQYNVCKRCNQWYTREPISVDNSRGTDQEPGSVPVYVELYKKFNVCFLEQLNSPQLYFNVYIYSTLVTDEAVELSCMIDSIGLFENADLTYNA
ncbi:hypothetical protein ACN38_g8487 [Penicillium nordicum]|uniref:Uncharacterized protein n=1 Tax=Penicillium nordicum TaxID=229535 RepID=A0A0M9WDP7_9EURO|nr:hypothetical protein ACN38_g8487 [Penicillium nordicum]